MLKMFKHLKKYAWALALIVLLLVVQAICDLTLPTYTAAIVDVGIQQSGVESAAPAIMRRSTLEALRLWMPADAYESVVAPAYTAASAEDRQRLGVTGEDVPLLALGKTDEQTAERLDTLFADAFMIQSLVAGNSGMDVSAMLQAGGLTTGAAPAEQGAAREQNAMPEPPAGTEKPDHTAPSAAPAQTASHNLTPEQLQTALSAMTPDEREQMADQLKEKLFSILPEGTVRQAAIAAVQEEYRALGMDLTAMQSRSIWTKGGLMLLVALLGAAAAVATGYFGSMTAAKLGRDLRGRVFHKVLRFGQREMDQFSTASLITRSTNDVQQVQMVMVMLLRMVIYAPIIGVGGVLRALNTNASMAWIIAVAVAVVITVVLVLMGLGMPRFKRMQTQLDKVNLVMRETLTGLPVIRAFCTQKREQERFDSASTALTKTQLFVGRLMSGMMPLMMLVMNGVAVLIMWTGAHGVDAGVMQVGDMIAYIQYTMQIIMAFLMVSMMSLMLPRASVAAQRIQEVLDTPLSVDDPEQPKDFMPDTHGMVEFRDVCFRYPGADEDTLSHISFTAKAGQTTAILGGTGSGKSTLVNLIPRFYDVTGGQVLVDGQDVRQVTLEALRARIGYVPQKAVLFSGTVEENLTFGSTDIPEARIKEAAKIAQAEDFILAREGGYGSELSQGGTNVSGGQKQRLSIARAIAKNPEIYVFDDSFSALDFKTDAALRAALHESTGDAAILIVAQRISTVMHAEQILVLDEGRLAGKGTHEELMRDCEVYRQIALSQLSKEELADGKE